MYSTTNSDSKNALFVLFIAIVVAVLSVVIYALTSDISHFISICSIGLLIIGAFAFVGGTLGFLFGIPRTLQQGGHDDKDLQLDSNQGNKRIDYRVNTNLEQISDWLTKILVGVGLTQINSIQAGIKSITSFLSIGLGNTSQSQVFAFVLLIYSIILGFLFGYLWTRLFLVGALRIADQGAFSTLSEKVETTERLLTELKTQSEIDAKALNLTYRQLNPSPDLPPIDQNEFDFAFTNASSSVKAQIFYQAWSVRSENWRDEQDKYKMERTIPIFLALTRSDKKKLYHRNHGQLGYALKDKRDPDWVEAEKELTIAIEIRGPWKTQGWLYYEYNRALCRIKIDPGFSQNRPSTPENRQKILNDLHAAAHAEEIYQLIESEPIIQQWMSMNSICMSDLSI